MLGHKANLKNLKVLKCTKNVLQTQENEIVKKTCGIQKYIGIGTPVNSKWIYKGT
jgi:hypothetical protein